MDISYAPYIPIPIPTPASAAAAILVGRLAAAERPPSVIVSWSSWCTPRNLCIVLEGYMILMSSSSFTANAGTNQGYTRQSPL